MDNDDTYPPSLTGMRGSGYPGAYGVGHQMRDGTLWPHAPDAIDTREEYDLVVVGAGISGLSAAYFYRQARKAGVRILILDNHDDFGGHAKRTQFTHNGDTRISNAGTFWIEGRYTGVARRLLAELGIDPAIDGDEVAVTYSRSGRLYKVTARHCILACWNYVVRYICPDLPAQQKEALSHNVKTPNLWVNVWLRNWRAFHRAKVNYINAPNSYYTSLILEAPVEIGGYRHSQSPDDPTVLTMLRVYAHPGQPASVQHRLGRVDLYNTSYETFEREAHAQLDRMLGPHGFNSARDILGLTINRWGHGYTYWDPTPNPADMPYAVRGRQPFGRTSIANTDAGGDDSSQMAMEQAYRAVHEVLLL